MKQLLIRKGQVEIQDVAAPVVQPGYILIRTLASCISAGTEMATVASSGESVLDKARRKPELIKKGMDMLLTQGVGRTLDTIRGKLDAGSPSGYSLCGRVIDTGAGVDDLQPGMRVAAAGAAYANHAEVVSVPRNLVVRVPENISDDEAASVTLGAIAMQGIRRASPTLGESAAVIGLGLLGQITFQLLKASGIRVIGFDLDVGRVEKARELGIDLAFPSNIVEPVEEAIKFSEGYGVDFAVITAATRQSTPLEQALDMCRKKGRVVIVGDVGLSMSRNKLYPKELDVFISTSYGPGRYDSLYEEGGQDYPIGYVRWTENRNMREYLRLISTGGMKISPLIDATFEFEKASEAYEALNSEEKPLLVVLNYPDTPTEDVLGRTIGIIKSPAPKKEGVLNVGIIGAGNFATAIHLPNLASMPDRYAIHSICDINPPAALQAATRFNASNHGTSAEEVCANPDIDIVLITTRHDQHAPLSSIAAENGKTVFCEKPMGVNRDETLALARLLKDKDTPYLVGFNRRFSPAVQKIIESIKHRSNPVAVIYTVNAGYLDSDHWTHGVAGGGRIVGEACHMIDVCSAITGSTLKDLNAYSITPGDHKYFSHDNVQIGLKYEDGSIAQITYTALGGKDYPKERVEVHAGGTTFVIDDYKSLTISGGSSGHFEWKSGDKGHREELIRFSNYLRGDSPAPIELSSMIETTLATFAVYDQIGIKP